MAGAVRPVPSSLPGTLVPASPSGQEQSRRRAGRALGGSSLNAQSLPAWGSSSLLLRHGSAILSRSPFMVPEEKQADAAGLALGRYLNEIAENSRKTEPPGWGWQPWTPPSNWHGHLNSQLWGVSAWASWQHPPPNLMESCCSFMIQPSGHTRRQWVGTQPG